MSTRKYASRLCWNLDAESSGALAAVLVAWRPASMSFTLDVEHIASVVADAAECGLSSNCVVGFSQILRDGRDLCFVKSL